MAGAASQAGDADSSCALGLTSGLQESVALPSWFPFVSATVTVLLYFTLIYF